MLRQILPPLIGGIQLDTHRGMSGQKQNNRCGLKQKQFPVARKRKRGKQHQPDQKNPDAKGKIGKAKLDLPIAQHVQQRLEQTNHDGKRRQNAADL